MRRRDAGNELAPTAPKVRDREISHQGRRHAPEQKLPGPADRAGVGAPRQVVGLGHTPRAERTEHELHRTVRRPWGSYNSLEVSERFQVKRIMVKPGEALSLQMHHHRAEHWIVVSGVAEVTCDDKVFLLAENESTYIPLGSKHRLRNPGKLPLDLIEVQSGSYLGEDDIVRFDDVYGRV